MTYHYFMMYNPALWAKTRVYVPLRTERDLALENLKMTAQALEEVRDTLQWEKVEHQSLVSDLKTDIKTTRAELNAIVDGTYTPLVPTKPNQCQNNASQSIQLNSWRSV
jgi:peptidoglycan hydrolase CwlO-like protein